MTEGMFHSRTLLQAQWSVWGIFFVCLDRLNMKKISGKGLFANARKLNRVNLASNSGRRNWNHQVGKTLKVVQNPCNLEGTALEKDFANSGGLINDWSTGGILQFWRQRLKPKVQ